MREEKWIISLRALAATAIVLLHTISTWIEGERVVLGG